jgi:amidohydrolase
VAALRATQGDAMLALGSFLGEAVGLRHRIHADPQVGGREQRTRAQILEAVSPLRGTDLFEGHILRIGGSSHPAVGIRAELDALPVEEESGVPWRSTTPGVAHLCGHDVHAAALTAVVKTMAAVGPPVPLAAVFQPREEVYPSGAADFVDAELLPSENLGAMVAVHLHPGIPDGFVSAASGTINASSDNFTVVVHGSPAHGAYPHLSRDPILAAASIVQGLQHIVSRRVDPMHPAVVTVGRIAGGASANVIPADVTLEGTLRAHDEADRAQLIDGVERVARSMAEAHGCTSRFSADRGEPVLRNDDRLARTVGARLEEHGYRASRPIRSCGADDFAFFAARVPSLMIFAGSGDGRSDSPGLHHPEFVPDDSSVETVARIMLLAYFGAAEALLDGQVPIPLDADASTNQENLR